MDPEYEKNEEVYEEIRREILGDSDDEESSDESEEGEDEQQRAFFHMSLFD